MTRNFELEARVGALEALLETVLVPLWRESVPPAEQAERIASMRVTVRKSGDRNWDEPLTQRTAAELRRWVDMLQADRPASK